MKRRIGRLKIFSPFHSEIRSSLLALLAACTFLATCTFCTQDAMAGAENGSAFKGALNLQAMLSTRFFKPSGTFDISSYFNQHLALQYGYIPPIIQLLGFYDSAGMSSAFVNGTPNPVNMLIHDVIFSSFTHELAQICVDSKAVLFSGAAQPINDDLTATLVGICAWSAVETHNANQLMDLWLQTMGYQAPEEEFIAWRDFFMSDDYSAASGQKIIEDGIYAILNNPYFLLRN